MQDFKWDKDKLYHLVQGKLGDYLFLVVSNREPYVHTMSGDEVICHRQVSGLTEALDPVVRSSKGTWVAEPKLRATRILTRRLMTLSRA